MDYAETVRDVKIGKGRKFCGERSALDRILARLTRIETNVFHKRDVPGPHGRDNRGCRVQIWDQRHCEIKEFRQSYRHWSQTGRGGGLTLGATQMGDDHDLRT